MEPRITKVSHLKNKKDKFQTKYSARYLIDGSNKVSGIFCDVVGVFYSPSRLGPAV